MRITDPTGRALLAGEYVLGTLRGRARARFELWLRLDPALRRDVAQWQERLAALDARAPEVTPSPAVWQEIQARIADRAAARVPVADLPWWRRLGFWQGTSFASGLAAALLLGYVAVTPREHALMPERAMVAVMTDESATPHITVAWTPDTADGRLRVRVMGHAEMAPDTAWELWMLPDGNQPPKSLGLISTHEAQTVEIPVELLKALSQADGLAMSVEPKGGSPTGIPTGPVLYSGRRLDI